jgi:hypothetical protein
MPPFYPPRVLSKKKNNTTKRQIVLNNKLNKSKFNFVINTINIYVYSSKFYVTRILDCALLRYNT